MGEAKVAELITSYRAALPGGARPEGGQAEAGQVAEVPVFWGQVVLNLLPTSSDWPGESWGLLMYDLRTGALLGNGLAAAYRALGNDVSGWLDMADQVRRALVSGEGAMRWRTWWSRRRTVTAVLGLAAIISPSTTRGSRAGPTRGWT